MSALSRFEADLHVHTLLSPCGEVEMVPSLIVAAAQAAGLDLMAVADHNSCENAGAVIRAAEGSGLRILPGLEAQSVEGVHLLCLFDELDAALTMQKAVYESLPEPPGAHRLYKEQMVVDEHDEFAGYCERPISMPTSLEIIEIWRLVEQIGGMVVPSHIDRMGTGMCGVLGMMPESPVFEAVEITANISVQEARAKYLRGMDCAVLHNSDAHWLSAIGQNRTVFHLERRSVSEIRLACRREGGRRVGDA